MYRPIICYNNYDSASTAVATMLSSDLRVELGPSVVEGPKQLHPVHAEEPHEHEALNLAESKSMLKDAILCPACDSPNVEYPASPQASPTMHLLDKMLDAVDPVGHKFMCRKCSHVWSVTTS